jgi:hypothetical protein
MAQSGSGGDGGVRRREFLRGVLAALGGGALATTLPSRARADEGEPGEGGAALSSRPYLFFGEGDLEGIRRRCATTMKPQLDALVAHAAEHLGDAVPDALHGGYERKADQIQSPFLVNIVNFSFLAVVTGEPRYREAARRWALGLASMGDLVGTFYDGGKCASCGYPEGWACTALAAAYDWLYPSLAEGERAVLRNKLAQLTRALYVASAGDEWWTGAYLHHDTWIPLGGLGIGAMALLDDTAEALTWADRAAHEILAALDWLDGDGAWPEGPCGWAFALQSVIPFLDAYRRRLPARAAALVESSWLANAWKFRVASRVPGGLFLGFGDCSANGSYQFTAYEGAPALRYLAARYQSPYAQWQAAREWEKRPNPYTAAWEIIWMDPSVGEAPPDELPTGMLFDNQQMAFLRTGWDPRGTVLAFRCDSLLGRRAAALFHGENVGRFNNSTTHVHADANSFAIWSRGAFALTMAKYGQNETQYQSSLLVDGQGQYTSFSADHLGRPDGLITGFLHSRYAGFVEGEAARCYPPGLSRYTRRLYLVQPGVVFLVDDIAAERPVELEWRIHVDSDASVEMGDGAFTSAIAGTRTWVRLARPSGVSFNALTDDWNRAVTISPGGRRTEAELCAVVVPSLPADAQPAIGTPGERSFVIEALGARITAAFARTPGALEIAGRLSAEGTAAIVTEMEGSVSFFVADATRLSVNGQEVLVASARVMASYTRVGGAGRLTVSAGQPTELRLRGVTLSVPGGRSSHDVG